jgi:hypothetical protein
MMTTLKHFQHFFRSFSGSKDAAATSNSSRHRQGGLFKNYKNSKKIAF